MLSHRVLGLLFTVHSINVEFKLLGHMSRSTISFRAIDLHIESCITPSELQLRVTQHSESLIDLETLWECRQRQGPCHKGFSWDE